MPRNGDGIYTRRDRPGFWISYQDSDGRRRRRKVEAANRTKAGDLRSGYVSREEIARAHGVKPPSFETFAEVADQYLSFQKARISEDNYERERGIVEDHLRPFFAGELRTIRRAMVSRYVTTRSGKVSSATVVKELNVLKHLLKLSVELWEYIPANPAHGVKPPKPAPGRVRYLQPSELRALLEAARSGCVRLSPWLPLLQCAALRSSACAGSISILRGGVPCCHKRKTETGESFT